MCDLLNPFDYMKNGLSGLTQTVTYWNSRSFDVSKNTCIPVGTGKKVGNVRPQHRSFKESRIFFSLLVSQNESATDFQRRVWCLKTKCNVSDQLGPFHWSTSQLQYLLPVCRQKVSFVLFFTVLYANNDISILFTSRRARIYSYLSWLYGETSFN